MSAKASAVLAWATDIHLDHADSDKKAAFFDSVRSSSASALLLGGDISTALDIEERLIEIAESVKAPVFFVLGNHDYYGDSIASVRERVGALEHTALNWLPRAGPQELAPGVALLGHGGWGDTRIGNFADSGVLLTDYFAIEDLCKAFDVATFQGTFGRESKLEKALQGLGSEAAAALSPQLADAAKHFRQLVILTHVPPFLNACWHEGRISGEAWLPAFSCGAMGEALSAAASAHPECEFTVLCGHTHSGGFARIAANLVVYTQGAEYGRPALELIEANEDGVQRLE